jgi:hypothetical protein
MASELVGDRPENRQMITKALATIARYGIQHPLPDIPTDFSHTRATAPGFNRVPQSPYRRVAARLQQEFILRAIASGNDMLTLTAGDPSVEEGCLVISKTLRYAPLGYLAYAAGKNQPPDMSELGDALLGSADAVVSFAQTDRDRARIYEEVFGIYPLADVAPHEPQPFVFTEAPQGLRYEASPQSLQFADARIATAEGTGELQEVGRHRKCAALGRVMDGLWERAVAICVEGPSLFPNDLSPQPVVYPANFPYEPPK